MTGAPRHGVWRRLAASRGAMTGCAVLGLLVLLAAFAPTLAPYDPSAQPDLLLRSQAPSMAHPFGTDPYSRDVLSRVLHGARVSLGIGVAAAALAALLGTAVGLVAGAAGPLVDGVLMRLVDAGLAVPRALVLLAAGALWGQLPISGLVVLLAGTGWFAVSRLVRADVRAIRHTEWALAATALGASRLRLWTRHLLPHALAPAIVAGTLGVGHAIALEGALSFLGLGVQPPAASWGNILFEAAEHPAALWWVAVFPGLALMMTVLAVNAIGDGLRDALDPREVAAP